MAAPLQGDRRLHDVPPGERRRRAYAPDLSDIGAIRTAATLQRTLLDPTGAMLPVNRPVRAVTSDGTIINGQRLNETRSPCS